MQKRVSLLSVKVRRELVECHQSDMTWPKDAVLACASASRARIARERPSGSSSPAPSRAPEDFNCPVSAPLLLYVRRLRRTSVLQRMPFPCSWFFAGLSSCTYSPQVPSSFPLLLQPPLRNRFHHPCPSGVSMKTTDGFGLKGVCAATHCGGSGASRRPLFAAKGSWECDLK